MQVPLRRQADVFTDLVELQSKLGRDPLRASGPARAAPSRAAIPAARHHEGTTGEGDDFAN
jgi:hypothetical protein